MLAPELDDYLAMARAYSDLGWAVQEQLHDLAGGERRPGLYNPNALALIRERYLPTLGRLDEDAAADLEIALDEAAEARQREEVS